MAKLGRMKLLDIEVPTRYEPGENTTYIAMRHVVEGLGLAWKPQYQKLTANRRYLARIRELRVRGNDGKHRITICMPRDCLDIWLRELDTAKIKPEARRRIELSRRQAANERRAVLEWMARDLRAQLLGQDFTGNELSPIETALIARAVQQPDRSLDDQVFPMAYEAVKDYIAGELAGTPASRGRLERVDGRKAGRARRAG